MKNEEQAFMQGLQDGLAHYEEMDKIAEVFIQGLVDGAADVQRVPIMDKIAQLLDGAAAAEPAEAEPVTAAERIRGMLKG